MEEVEDRSLKEPLGLERTEDEFSKCGKSKITYARDLLMKFMEVEACGKLPVDFDMLRLRELDGESDGMIEQQKFSGKSSLGGPLLSTGSNLDFPGERLGNHTLNKWGPWREKHRLERSDAVCQQLPQESGFNAGILGRKIQKERNDAVCQQLPQQSGYNAGILGRKIQKERSDASDAVCQQLPQKSGYNPSILGPKIQKEKSDALQESGYNAATVGQKIQKGDLNQLRKSENPYRPPHRDKIKLQETSNTSPGVGAETPRNFSFSEIESDQRCSTDSITKNDKSRYEVPLPVAVDSMGTLGECEAPRRNNEESGMVGPNEKLELRIIENDQRMYDEYWAEILEIIQLQLEPKRMSPTRDRTPDLEPVLYLPDDDSLVSVDLVATNNRKKSADSEAEIRLPDEDSLITIYDMTGPHYSSIPKTDRISAEADKLLSYLAFNMRKDFDSLNCTKWDDRSTYLGCSPQSFRNFSSLATQREKDHRNFHRKSMTPNITPYIPPGPPRNFSAPNFHHQSFEETNLTTRNTNNSLVQYSLLQQPNIRPGQQNHLLVDASCPNPVKQVPTHELNAMRFLHWPPQRPPYEGFDR